MIREKIWYEMVDAKYGEMYLAYYLGRCRSQKKIFKMLMLIFSAGGVFGWSIWEPVAVVACGLIAAMQLLSLLEKQLIKSDDDLIKICELRELYIKYVNKLENLWTEFESGSLNDADASNRFNNLRETIKHRIEISDNAIYINGNISSILNKCNLEHTHYLNNRYGKANKTLA